MAESWFDRNRAHIHLVIRILLIITLVFVIVHGIYSEIYDDDICNTDDEFLRIIDTSETLKKITSELEPEHKQRYIQSLYAVFKGSRPSTFMQYYTNIRASLVTALLGSYLLTGELSNNQTSTTKTVVAATLNTLLTS